MDRQIKYLGVMFDASYNLNKLNVLSIKRKFYAVLNSLLAQMF